MTFLSDLAGRIRQRRDVRRSPPAELPPDAENLEHNRALWNQYAQIWRKDAVRSEAASDAVKPPIEVLGDEWGRAADVDRIVAEYITPFVTRDGVAVEIGVGGGRIARRVAPQVRTLYCLDISEQMLARAQAALAGCPNIIFALLTEPRLSGIVRASPDFVYSFDVFVHFDLHMMWTYFQEVARVLQPGGHFFVHTANLTAPEGWQRFAAQDHFTVPGHYFVVPQTIATLAAHAGLTLVKESAVDSGNFYLARDYLCVLRK